MALPQVSPSTYRRLTLFALWVLVLIVVTGASVRLTGSGLGCTEWPTCEAGSLAPRSQASYHAWIEFVNRLITGLVSVGVILAVLGSLLRRPRRRDLTWLSLGLVAGVAAQAVLGAFVVKFDVHPIVVQGHFLLSALLVADGVVLWRRAGRPDGVPVRPVVTDRTRHLGAVLVALASAVLLAGTVVTGTGPHAGDADAERLDFAITTVARVHSACMWLLLAGIVWFAVRARAEQAPPVVMERLRRLVVVVVLQGVLGYLQYATGVPALLAGLHVLGSMLVWMAVIDLDLGLSAPVPGTRESSGEHGTGRDLVANG